MSSNIPPNDIPEQAPFEKGPSEKGPLEQLSSVNSRRNFIKNLSASVLGIGGLRIAQAAVASLAGIATGTWGYQKILAGQKKYAFSGSIVGANFKVGHLLKTGGLSKPGDLLNTGDLTKTGHSISQSAEANVALEKTVETLIVGGGIAGLSAAWWFNKKSYKDYLLLEMDTEVGGNSASGANTISKYPWGAHYVPIPGPEAQYVRELFEEMGIITGYQKGLPIYNEYYLCAEPNERLFFQGDWQEGLVPQHGIQESDKKQYREFFTYIEELKKQKGSDGKPIFSIPLELSSQDENFLRLDKISMAEFMQKKFWNSSYLNWYVNYSCRDDYGMPHDKVSAWAGLHYFASRSQLGANADAQSVLTWPEGNGFLVSHLKNKVADRVQNNSLVYSIENSDSGNIVEVLNTKNNTSTRYYAKNIIYCGPRFTANKIIKGYSSNINLDCAPWVVANISLKHKPNSHGVPLAWDNVSYYSKSLGYIFANHQDIKINRNEAVITYYRPLNEIQPVEARAMAYQKSYHDWLNMIVPDLEKMHPGISSFILHVDVWVWGHGMVSPGIDFLWSAKRKEFLKPFRSIEFAHSDMSGISIFEEAQYRGVEAAKKILSKVSQWQT